jgi:hypothetical protein
MPETTRRYCISTEETRSPSEVVTMAAGTDLGPAYFFG